MKVGLVSPYDLGVPGGVQDQVVNLARWLGAEGIETVVVGPGTEGPEGAVLVGSSLSVPVNRSAAPIGVDPRMVSRLRSALESCDVVHVHEPLVPVVSLTAARIGDRPTVGTFHADPSSMMRRSLRFAGPAARRLLGRLDVITAVSPVAASAVPSKDAIRIIPNGVDTGSFSTGPKTPASVVFLGRDEPRKGLDVLLEAWPAVRKAVPEAVLTIVGAERDDEIPGVTWLGRVTEEEKRRALASAEVFVAPNTGGESFGIILVEAMSSGCVVVASALPAFTRVLAGSGELVQPRDPAGLSSRIIDVLDDPVGRAERSTAGLERARRFDGGAVAAEYAAAYRDAVTRHGR